MNRELTALTMAAGLVLGMGVVAACGASGSTADGGATTTTTGTSTALSFSTSSAASTSTSTATSMANSTTTSSASTTPDAGSGTGDGGSTTSSSASGSSTASGSTSGSAGDGGCYKAPTALHAETKAGVYCPFSVGDAGKATTCAAGQHCCEPPESAATASTCEPATTACPVAMSTDWACEGAFDCASKAGTVCCGTGTIGLQAAQPACGDGGIASFSYVTGYTGSACSATCTTYQICSKDSECPGAATGSCVPIEPKGGGIGYCKEHGDAGAHDAGEHDAGGTCTGAGGACVALVPNNCAAGHIGSATTYSCGGGLGLECCLPN